MGRIICETHGKTGMEHVCSHIGQAVRDRTPLPERSIVELDLEGETALELTFCNACIHERGIQSRVTSDELELSDSKFKTEPVCAKCLRSREP